MTDRATPGGTSGSIARQMQVDVYTCGELVVLQLGTFGVSMHFADALKVSGLLLVHGRAARRAQLGGAAQFFPRFRVMGILQDLTRELKKSQARWTKKPPELYKGSEILVRQNGFTVDVAFRKTIAGLPWEAALSIAQHLRVRGKQARDSVNEKAHWSELAEMGKVDH